MAAGSKQKSLVVSSSLLSFHRFTLSLVLAAVFLFFSGVE